MLILTRRDLVWPTRQNQVALCHDPNLRFMISNVGGVLKGHPIYIKPQNEHIKRISYLKIHSI
jgi:hypothetical protein